MVIGEYGINKEIMDGMKRNKRNTFLHLFQKVQYLTVF